MDSGKIFTVTLNPAIDKILFMDKFKAGVTTRLSGTKKGLGGKGTHVSLNLKTLGMDNVASVFIHGETGKEVLRMLEDAGVETSYIQYETGETRTNYLMIEADGESSCLSEPGIPLTDEDIERYIKMLRKQLHDGDYLVLSGGVANCPDPYVYSKIMNELADIKLKVFLDASGEALKKGVEARPYFIKPNRDELEELTGRRLRRPADIIDAIKSLDEYEIPVIAVSLGEEGAIIKIRGTYYIAEAVNVQAKNTIGCGDCFLAGMIYGIKMELPVEETIAIAMASSGATAESMYSVGFDYDRYKSLKTKVVISQVK